MSRIKLDAPIAAFLDLIAWAEGTSTHKLTHDDGYDVIVSGVDGLHTFSDYSIHPFSQGRAPVVVRPDPNKILSTASGRYQFELATWEELSKLINRATFDPVSQDYACLHLLESNRAITPILSGQMGAAFERVCTIWASFPGNLYGQGGKTAEELVQEYALCKARALQDAYLAQQPGVTA